MSPVIRLKDCLWIRTQHGEDQPVMRPMIRSLKQRGAQILVVNVSSPVEMAQLRERLWKSDQHVILQGMLPKELNALQPIFERRKNFSIMPIDWWVSPFWYARHATYNIFHTYNGIMVHTRRAPFLSGAYPPWFYVPQRRVAYEYQSALLRPAGLLTAPVLDVYKAWQRTTISPDPGRYLYFPYPIAEADVPLHADAPQYDFTNLGAIMGTWFMRDPYVPAALNFSNLYADRQRLIKLIAGFQGQPFSVYDRRQHKAFVPWDELTRIIRQSRFVVCTGGIHLNAVPKFLEYACLGIPMFGTGLPFEHPWLDDCLVPVDPMRITPAELKVKLTEALDRHVQLRQNCLAMREPLLRLFHPDTLLDLLDAQMAGKAIPPGYLRV